MKKAPAKMKKKSMAKMKKGPMKITKAQKTLPENLQKAIVAKEKKDGKNPITMKKAAMKMKKESMAMLKKSVAMMKKASAMKMNMKKKK